jgi:hypothetical protein
MGYDYGTYKKQYDDNAKKYKGEKSLAGDEYLSRMKKTDRFMPVITVVVYYGEKSWDAAISLHGILDAERPAKEIKENVMAYLKSHTVDRSVIMTAVGTVNARIDHTTFKEGDDADMFMSKVFRDTWAEGEADGREEGEAKGIVETGKRLDLTADAIIQMLQDCQGISLQKAKAYHDRFSR